MGLFVAFIKMSLFNHISDSEITMHHEDLGDQSYHDQKLFLMKS